MADLAETARRKSHGKRRHESCCSLETVQRIHALFEIQRSIKGASTEQRRAVRQKPSAPLVADLQVGC